jgi:hypothetical protein
MAAEPSLLPRRLVLALVSVDVLVVLLHVLTDGAEVFNLDAEANVPTWYSSAKLLCIAVAALAAWHAEGADAARGLKVLPNRWLWLAAVGLFTVMSMDETAQIHERTARVLVQGSARSLRTTLLGGDANKDSYAWVVLAAPIAVAVVFFMVAFAWTRRVRLKRVLPLGIAGLACYLTALVLEPAAVYFTPKMADWDAALRHRYESFSMVEESCEIVGTTFFFFTVLAYVLVTRREQNAAKA